MARLTAHDAARWEALAARAVPAVEARLAPAVLGNRARSHGGSFRLRPLEAALAGARRAASSLGRGASLVIRTDVAGFYPSVTPAVLARGLRDVPGRHHAADMLEGWGSEGYAGLPIGPEASAVLANAVLAPVDAALAGLPFLRWVDDYLVGVCCDRGTAEVLERIDAALAGLGLRRSEAKTSFTEGGRGLRWPGTSGTPGPSN